MFNVRPPLSASERQRLEAHIAEKRQKWRRDRGMGSPNAVRIATQVLAVIDALSQALLRGTPLPEKPVSIDEPFANLPRDIQALWDEIRRLLDNNNYDRAIRVAEEMRVRRPRLWDGHAALGYVVATGAPSGFTAHTSLLQRGLDALKIAMSLDRTRLTAWNSAAYILVALNRLDAVLTLRDNAAKEFGTIPTDILSAAATIQLSHGRIDEALKDVVRAVMASSQDLGVRGELAAMLISRGARPVLPIQSREALRRYAAVVQVAAWCAVGVPEAENGVRPHRLWAALAARRLFVGNPSYRCLMAFMTMGVWPLLYNRVRSKAAWQVALSPMWNRPELFALLEADFVRRAHGGYMPWELVATRGTYV